MVMPENNKGKPPEAVLEHKEVTDTLTARSGQQIVISSRWWGAQAIDSIVLASKSANINNLLLLIMLAGAIAVTWRVLPPIIDVLNTMNRHIPEQTELMKAQHIDMDKAATLLGSQNSTMDDIKRENVRRNDLQEQAIKVQNDQAVVLGTITQLEKDASANNAKIIEGQNRIAELLQRSTSASAPAAPK